jgi:Nif-specific regulatory protein
MKTTSMEENVLERCVSECEKAVITHVLKRTQGNQSAAARMLGLTKRIFGYKVRKYGIESEKWMKPGRRGAQNDDLDQHDHGAADGRRGATSSG